MIQHSSACLLIPLTFFFNLQDLSFFFYVPIYVHIMHSINALFPLKRLYDRLCWKSQEFKQYMEILIR